MYDHQKKNMSKCKRYESGYDKLKKRRLNSKKENLMNLLVVVN